MGRQRPARGAAAAGADQRQRRHLDERRRQPGRTDDRLRPPGRHLHHGNRRRAADADQLGPRLRHAAALLARRPADRLHVGPGRRRQYLGDERRRLGRPRHHPRDFPPPQRADLEPGRAIYRRAQAFHHPAFARHRRDLALPCLGRRRGRASGRTAQSPVPEGIGRARLCARRRVHLFQPQHHVRQHLRICPGFEPAGVRDRALRHRHRRAHPGRRRPRRRGPADPLARRPLARLRPPHRRPQPPLRQGFALRRGAAGLCRSRPGSAGDLGGPWRLSQHGLDPRQPDHHLLGRRQDPARRPRRRRGRRNPVRGRRQSRRHRSAAADGRGRAGQHHHPHAALRRPLAGRQPGGVRDARTALHTRPRRRGAAAADRPRRRLPAVAGLVARRPQHRLRLVERRAARRNPHRRRRRQQLAHGHHPAGPLPPPALLAGRGDHRLRAERRRRADLEPMVRHHRHLPHPGVGRRRHPHPRRGQQPPFRRGLGPRLPRGQPRPEAQADQRRPERRQPPRPRPGRDGHRL